MYVKKRIYQNINRENRKNKIKKQKSFIIDILDLSHDERKNQIKNINRNEIFNESHNIKKNISFDNKKKEKNKNICTNLQKEYYGNNDKNLSNHKVLNKTPEPRINNKKIICNFNNYKNEINNVYNCQATNNAANRFKNEQVNEHKIFNYNYLNNTQQNRNKSQDIKISKVKKRKRNKNNNKIENNNNIQTVNNIVYINIENNNDNYLTNISNDCNINNNNINNINFNYNNFHHINNNKNNKILLWNIKIIDYYLNKYNIIISPYKTIGDLLNEIYLKFYDINIEFCDIISKNINLRKIDKSLKIYQFLFNNSIVNIIERKNVKGGDIMKKEINIKFIKLTPNIFENNCDYDFNLHGLLKLCLLKEISLKLDYNRIAQMPLIISSIMEILKNGEIKSTQNKECIKEVLNNISGSNIINFSRYVNKIIDLNYLKNILRLLNENEFYEINDIKNRLKKYNQYITYFEKEFENSKKNSIFEFSIISLTIMESQNLWKFEEERIKCPNRVDKILYHGTGVEPISLILTGRFKKAEIHFFGEGVYFTDSLDYCRYYGGNKNNKENINKIPKIDETFSFIASSIYYSYEGLRKVKNGDYNPKKNEANIVFANAHAQNYELNFPKNEENKQFFREYVINDLDQICPFIGAKLKRDKFCVVWRDINFSNNQVYDQFYDKLFKDFLKRRVEYIENLAKFNIYLFDNSEEALKLIERKKYNKIILISNVGADYGGKEFISKAREILENNVIALFLAYNEEHLNWIQYFKNALFSNDPEFYERYLRCFEQEDENQIISSLNNLKELIESHYSVTFNFDDKFLEYPLFRKDGYYSELKII